MEEQDPWQECISLIAQQNKAALGRFYAHFAPKIKAFGRNQGALNDLDSFCDDLVQEVMVKIWNKADQFDGSKSKVNTWVYAIARNCRIDLLRKKTHQPLPLMVEDIWDEAFEEGPLHDLQMVRNESNIKESIDTLSVEFKTVLAKAYFEGKSHGEIAKELDLPLGTVKSRIRFALKKLHVLVDR